MKEIIPYISTPKRPEGKLPFQWLYLSWAAEKQCRLWQWYDHFLQLFEPANCKITPDASQ